MMGEVLVFDDWDLTAELRAKQYTDSAGYLLATTYPGYRWRVEYQGGCVIIRNEHTRPDAAEVLHPDKYFSETQWRAAVKRKGGDLLERAELSRRGLDLVAWKERPRDFAGRIQMDIS